MFTLEVSVHIYGIHHIGAMDCWNRDSCTIENQWVSYLLLPPPLPTTRSGVGCSVIAFALASRLAAVVLSTTVPRTSPKEDKAPLALVPLNIQYEDLTKTTPAASVADENEDDLNEVEKQPHFNDGNKSETTLHEES